MFPFSEPKVPQISAEEVKHTMDTGGDYTLIDVRTPGEFSRGRLAGSTNVPVDQIHESIENTVPDKNRKVYVYCLSGSRSVHAVDAMVKMGYTNVFDMKQGLLAWRAHRYPLAT